MCEEPPASRLKFLLRGDGTAMAIHDGNLEIRLLAQQRDNFTDVVHGLPLPSASGPFQWYSFLNLDSSLGLRWKLTALLLQRKRPALRNRACDDGRELPAVFLKLRF